MGEIGGLAISLAFVVSLYGGAAPLLGQALKRPELARSGSAAGYAKFLLRTIASPGLRQALLARDFGNAYVASYSSRDLGFCYTIAAFWAGQAGSLLFWALLLTGFAALVVWRPSLYRERLPYFVGP